MAATKDNEESGGRQEHASTVVAELVGADVPRSLGTDAAQSWTGLLRSGAAHEILVSTLDALVVIDSSGSVVEWNPSAAEIFGYSRDEAVGVTIAELIVPDELRDAHRAGIKNYLETGEGPVLGQRLTMPALHADGSKLTVELSITALPGSGEALFAGWLRDVTAIQMARAEADRSSELLTAVLQNVSEFITIFGADGTLRFASGGKRDGPLVGAAKTAVADGRTSLRRGVREGPAFDVTSLLHPDDAARGRAIFAAIVRGERSATERWDMRTIGVGGASRTFETVGENLLDHPTVQGIIFSSRDVTEERASQARIVAAEQSARLAAEAQATALREVAVLKSELLAMVSHELRTPLTAILSFTEILSGRLGAGGEAVDDADGSLEPNPLSGDALREARNMVGIIDRNAQLLTRLVDDLLLVGRRESGAVSVEPKLIEVRPFVEEFVDGVLPEAESLGIDISVTINGTEPVWADPARVTQVLQNLVGNAFKFAPVVTNVALDLTPSDEYWWFSVTDDGPGIAEDVRLQIFEKFFRGTSSEAVSGTGLGLAVSKALVELHGGEISVSSVVGHGSTFSFNLPKGSGDE